MYDPREYWSGLATGLPYGDSKGFGPVLHPDAPAWFNELIDRLQLRAIRRALTLANLPAGARILDVGCGTGRWIRHYRQRGFHATGVDATPAMLSRARQLGTDASSLVVGEAYRLPFQEAEFDCVSDVTVTQHIPEPLQSQALSEMLRVLRPGGSLILMELIRGNGPHIFPHVPQDWISQVASRGARLVRWFGQEYLLLDRLFVTAARIISGESSSSKDVTLSPGVSHWNSSTVRRFYWGLRHATASLSAWTDPLAEAICPSSLATHGVFVFRK